MARNNNTVQTAAEAQTPEINTGITEAQTPEINEGAPMTNPVTDPWKEKKSITIPRLPGKSQPPLTGSVNGRTFSLPRGKTHEVPLPIYEVVARSLANEEKADDYYYGIQAELTARAEEEAANMK